MSNLESHQDKDSVSQSGAYRKPERVLSRELLRDLIETPIKRELDGRTPYPEETIERIEANLREFQSSCESGLAFDDLMALMNEEIGSLESLYHDDDLFQSKKIDAQALWTLYGAMLHVGEEPEDAARFAYIYYYHCCEQDENDRRFIEWPEVYRQNQLRDAIRNFDKGTWNRWFRRTHPDGFDDADYRNWTGDYGDVVYDTIRALVFIACLDTDPERIIYDVFELDYDPSSKPITCLANGEFDDYTRRTTSFHKIGRGSNSSPYRGSQDYRYVPMEAVVNVAMEVDEQSGGDGRSRRTYKNAIRRLRKHGMVKWAQIEEGEDYRLYPESIPDPPEAELIKFEGEDYVPKQEEEDVEQAIMTDGGDPASRETAETFTCPVEGCSRTVIGSPGHLRNHVAQAGDDAHRFLTLNEGLRLEFDEAAYHATWGPLEASSEGEPRANSAAKVGW